MRACLLFIAGALMIGANATPKASNHPARCRQDQCLRALEPNNKSIHFSKARRDCSSFVAATVKPAIVTTTKTVYKTSTSTPPIQTISTTDVTTTSTTTTVVNTILKVTTTVTSIIPPAVKERDIRDFPRRQVTKTNSNIPPYASACTDTAAYSSACRCLGIKATTKTLATRTTTSTVTISRKTTIPGSTTTDTVTSSTETDVSTVQVVSTIGTTTVSGALSTATFILQVSDPQDTNDPSGPIYVRKQNDGSQAFFTSDISQAGRFSLGDDGSLIYAGLACTSYAGDFPDGYAISEWEVTDDPAWTCSLAQPLPASGQFSCQVANFDTFVYFENNILNSAFALGPNPPTSEDIQETAIQLIAVPIFVPAV